MIARLRNEEGASLILALLFVTVIAVAAVAIAGLGFSSQKASVIYTDQRTAIGALDGGLQATIENARAREPFSCEDPPPPPDPPPTVSVPVDKGVRQVRVECVESDAATPNRLTFTARIESPRPPCAEPQPPQVEATVSFATVGGDPEGARLARVASWNVLPPAVPCEEPPP